MPVLIWDLQSLSQEKEPGHVYMESQLANNSGITCTEEIQRLYS